MEIERIKMLTPGSLGVFVDFGESVEFEESVGFGEFVEMMEKLVLRPGEIEDFEVIVESVYIGGKMMPVAVGFEMFEDLMGLKVSVLSLDSNRSKVEIGRHLIDCHLSSVVAAPVVVERESLLNL